LGGVLGILLQRWELKSSRAFDWYPKLASNASAHADLLVGSGIGPQQFHRRC
jgi:hypothetical protein